MKKHICWLIFGVFLMCSCDSHKPLSVTPFSICRNYGAPVVGGEGLHSGIDFKMSQGTPIIAATEGEVSQIGDSYPEASYSGGIFVRVRNLNHFDHIYAHLSRVYVEKGQFIERGQLIGLSGFPSEGLSHFHFGICKVGGDSQKYSQTYDPDQFWLKGIPTCFNPGEDYAQDSRERITLPIACKAYAKKVIAAEK